MTPVRTFFSAKFKQEVLNNLKEKGCLINAAARNFGIVDVFEQNHKKKIRKRKGCMIFPLR